MIASVVALLLAAAAPSADDVARAITQSPGRSGPRLAQLQLLLDEERTDEVVPALGQALAAAGDDATPEEWLTVPAGLFELGRAEEALEAARLIEKKWPRHAGVLGTKGAALAVLERDEEALIYLRAAAGAAPKDPVHRWNLARLLAYLGRNHEAATEFATWSSIETDRDRLVRHSCLYASFVEKQLGDRDRACRLQQEFCPEPSRGACAPLPEPPK